MNDSFSNSTSTTSKSFLGAAKVPPPAGEPNDNWTVEELVRWSLEQYRSKVIERTSSSIASLRDQCEKECMDVIKLHEVAVEMKLSAKSNTTKREGGNAVTAKASTGASSPTRRTEEENVNPQVEIAQRSATTRTLATVTAASLIDDNAGTSTISSSNNNISASNTDPIATGTIEITITSGPHASTTYTLHPTISAPCLVGRSKGKKFVKNGISLFKDQEVSTTHGKFVVEEKEDQNTKNGNNGSSSGLLFYFVDVGSTNGTLHNGVALEPHQQLLLESGMELKVGNSVLKILLG